MAASVVSVAGGRPPVAECVLLKRHLSWANIFSHLSSGFSSLTSGKFCSIRIKPVPLWPPDSDIILVIQWVPKVSAASLAAKEVGAD